MTPKLLCIMFATPPGLNITLLCISWLSALCSKRLATRLLGFNLMLLYFFASPLLTLGLAKFVERIPPLSNFDAKADAIVLLGGGNQFAPEYSSGLNPGQDALARMQYAAYIHKKTDLPIIASGGQVANQNASEARIFHLQLKSLYNIDKVIEESNSLNTWENARFVKIIADTKKIDRVYLVTNSWHMPRAVYAFERAGIKVIPAPTGYFSNQYPANSYTLLIPAASAMHANQILMLETIGYLAYHFK